MWSPVRYPEVRWSWPASILLVAVSMAALCLFLLAMAQL